MQRITSIIAIIIALTVAGSSSIAAINGTDYDYKVPHSAAANQADFWVSHFEAKGYTNASCTKYGDWHSGWLPGHYEAGIVKAGQWNYVWLQPDSIGRLLVAPQDLSHILKCSWEGQRILEPEAKMRAYGPKGDPWYRFVMRNTGDTPATCLAKYTGKNGDHVIKKRLQPDQGFRTKWVWVLGSTKVKMACWSQGERIFFKTFRSAAPGYYGPLWHGFPRGYFGL